MIRIPEGPFHPVAQGQSSFGLEREVESTGFGNTGRRREIGLYSLQEVSPRPARCIGWCCRSRSGLSLQPTAAVAAAMMELAGRSNERLVAGRIDRLPHDQWVDGLPTPSSS
jgi:hypothetical protein